MQNKVVKDLTKQIESILNKYEVGMEDAYTLQMFQLSHDDYVSNIFKLIEHERLQAKIEVLEWVLNRSTHGHSNSISSSNYLNIMVGEVEEELSKLTLLQNKDEQSNVRIKRYERHKKRV